MNETRLSGTMQKAVAFMAEQGGGLRRLPGGFWVGLHAPSFTRGETWFGTTTVEALVARGVATYTEWFDGATRFPIRCELTKVGQS